MPFFGRILCVLRIAVILLPIFSQIVRAERSPNFRSPMGNGRYPTNFNNSPNNRAYGEQSNFRSQQGYSHQGNAFSGVSIGPVYNSGMLRGVDPYIPQYRESGLEASHCQLDPRYGSESVVGSRVLYNCLPVDNLQLRRTGLVVKPKLQQGNNYFGAEINLDYSIYSPALQRDFPIDYRSIVPYAGRVGTSRDEAGPAINYIWGHDNQGNPRVRLIEVNVEGKLGRAQFIPGTTTTVRTNFTSRIYYKVDDQQGICPVAAIGVAPPETYSLGKYAPCEYLNNSTPRFRASHFAGAQLGAAGGRKMRENLLRNMPACGSVSLADLQRNAMTFPEWPGPKETFRGDKYFHEEYCLPNGNPNPRFNWVKSYELKSVQLDWDQYLRSFYSIQ